MVHSPAFRQSIVNAVTNELHATLLQQTGQDPNQPRRKQRVERTPAGAAPLSMQRTMTRCSHALTARLQLTCPIAVDLLTAVDLDLGQDDRGSELA